MSADTRPELADAPEMLVEFYPLIRRAEEGEWIIGRAPHGPFIALPDVGIETIDLLTGGETVAGAMRQLCERHGDLVDVAAFVESLDRIGLIATIAGRPALGPERQRPHGAALAWLRPEHVRWLPTRVVAGLWISLIAAATTVLLTAPRTRPHFSDLVWSHSALLVILAAVVLLSAATFLHELGHLAVARAYGIAGTISVSTRLTFLVAQTDVSGAWALPRSRRILIYLAGMATELAIAAACVLALPALDWASGTATLLRSVVLTLVLSVLFECTFFLRTDVYYLVQDLAKCRNLYADARCLLGYWAARYLRIGSFLAGGREATDPRSGLARREQRVITGYTPFLLTGVLVTLAVFATVMLPMYIQMIIVSVDDVTRGLRAHSLAELADGIVSLAVMAGFDGLLLVLSVKKIARATRRLAELRTAATAGSPQQGG